MTETESVVLTEVSTGRMRSNNFDLEKSVFFYAELPIGLMCEVFGAKALIFSTSLDGPKVFIFRPWNEQIACIVADWHVSSCASSLVRIAVNYDGTRGCKK